LLRGDTEEKIEREIKNAICSQATGIDAYLGLDSSTNIEESCKQVREVLASSDDHTSEKFEGILSSKGTEQTNTGNHPFPYGLVYEILGRVCNRRVHVLIKYNRKVSIILIDISFNFRFKIRGSVYY